MKYQVAIKHQGCKSLEKILPAIEEIFQTMNCIPKILERDFSYKGYRSDSFLFYWFNTQTEANRFKK